MKVTIEHGEVKEGFVRKTTYCTVTVHVIFSEEEKAALKDKNPTVLKRPVPANIPLAQGKGIGAVFDLTLSQLMKGPNTYVAGQISDARQYEEDLKDALKGLKAYIDGNKTIENKSSSFEL